MSEYRLEAFFMKVRWDVWLRRVSYSLSYCIPSFCSWMEGNRYMADTDHLSVAAIGRKLSAGVR